MSSKNKPPYRIIVIDSNVTPNRTDLLVAELSRFASEREFEVIYLPRRFFHEDAVRTFWQKIGNAIRNFAWMNLVLIAALRADAIHVGPMNNRVLSLALKLKRLLNIKVTYDVYASIVLTDDETIEFGGTVADREQRLQRERDGLAGCDLLMFLQRAEYQAVCDRLQLELDPQRVRIVPLAGIQPDVTANIADRASDRQLNIVWWGNFSPMHGVDVVLDALQLLKKDRDHGTGAIVHLAIYGKGTNRFDLPAAVESRGLGDMVTLDFEKIVFRG